jgi:hypothetical protein
MPPRNSPWFYPARDIQAEGLVAGREDLSQKGFLLR